MAFEDDNDQESLKWYYRPAYYLIIYNVMIDWRNFFDQQIKNDLKTYNRKIVTGQDERGQPYLMGKGACLVLVGWPSSDGVTIKMCYGLDVLHQPA